MARDDNYRAPKDMNVLKDPTSYSPHESAGCGQGIPTDMTGKMSEPEYRASRPVLSVHRLIRQRAQEMEASARTLVNKGDQLLRHASYLHSLAGCLPNEMPPAAEEALKELLKFAGHSLY